MLTAAMKGELGPLTQAMVKYQMERKIQSMMKKLKEEELQKIQTANKTSDQDVSFFGTFYSIFFCWLRQVFKFSPLSLQAASDNWLTRWRQEMSQTPEDKVPLSQVQDQNDQEAQRRIEKAPTKSATQKDKLVELTKLYKSQNANAVDNTTWMWHNVAFNVNNISEDIVY